jgi:hypothetical protein
LAEARRKVITASDQAASSPRFSYGKPSLLHCNGSMKYSMAVGAEKHYIIQLNNPRTRMR